jgi:hypothetical protein
MSLSDIIYSTILHVEVENNYILLIVVTKHSVYGGLGQRDWAWRSRQLQKIWWFDCLRKLGPP